ncbi:DegT/DnrJ/EryC1/StrS family aminotransferase [Desertivirga arenae]|uniref:DegT/DnrJ/EryC1/StrS family aminotransferase n=1 Tax=Desertivirga arenae TaxID=2810309 RepID=UPI001A972886|nr:DegT/DnrJ/EryC1/StrS family aminotransferase [Pedobacter sp. SYSU D00823]
MIPVTKPYLPDLKEFDEYIASIWERQWLTNNGPLVNELEIRLKEYLNVNHMLYVSNGTIALQIAIKALGLKGEIITTPFSFIATTSSIVWEGCEPVFVDIEADTFNIDPLKIEEAITPKTSAILATHVFGNPCKVEAIQRIANKYGLKVIYDAAHCFGTKYKGRSVYEYGDISTTSFHATKLFHTIEGGAVFTQNPDLLKRMVYMRNFGHHGPEEFVEVGINGKNCELHAAMGLCNLNHADEILAKRKLLYEYYLKRLANVKCSFQQLEANQIYNYAYFPVVFESEELMLNCMNELKNEKVFCRRYFYPSLASLPFLDKTEMPVCDSIVNRILCLPLYHTLTTVDLDMICRIILRVQNYSEPKVFSAEQQEQIMIEKQIDDLLRDFRV